MEGFQSWGRFEKGVERELNKKECDPIVTTSPLPNLTLTASKVSEFRRPTQLHRPKIHSLCLVEHLEINSSDGSESDNSLRSARSLELNKFNSNDNLPQVLAVCCLASFKFELEPADNFDWQHFLSSFSARRIHKKDRTIASKVTMS